MKNILVALDLTAMDVKLIKAADVFSQQFHAETVKFLHVIPSFMIPADVQTSIENLLSESYHIDLAVENEMIKEVNQYFSANNPVKRSTEVKVGKTSKMVEQSANDSDTDLLVLGKKITSNHSGIAAKYVARRTNSNVLFIIENANLEFNHLLVPIDFSAYSLKALQMAFEFKKINPTTQITAIHVIDFPPKELYLTGQYGLLATDWKDKVNDMFIQFAKLHGINSNLLKFKAIKNQDFNISAQIGEYAHQTNADLIIVGAKGHSGLDDLFLGSVTEKLVTAETLIPILIVR